MSGSGPGTEAHDVSVPISLIELELLLDAAATLRVREEELLEIRGACRNPACPLHYAHRGDCRKVRSVPLNNKEVPC